MKRLIPTFMFIAYSALLIKVMVFKDVPVIRFGQLMFSFGGTSGGHPPNFVPFTTIVPYLFGDKGLVIAGINLLGNVAFLVPLGLLAALVFANFSWKKSLVLSVTTGLVIETWQALLDIGVFDVDDVILNGLGVMVGYWIYLVLAKWVRAGQHKSIIFAVVMLVVVTAGAVYALYPKGQSVVNPANRSAAGSGNLCGDTNGTGEIVALGGNSMTLELNDGREQTLVLTRQTTVENAAGVASQSDLQTGDRVTVVVEDRKTASLVLVCGG